MPSLLDVSAVLESAAKATLPEYGLLQTEQRNYGGADGIEDVIGTLRCGLQAHFVSDGAWSLHQLVNALLDYTGPAFVCLSSYAMSENAVRMFSQAMDTGRITQLYAAIDNRIETRTAGSLQLLQSIATGCALMPCHAKVTVITGVRSDISIVLIGSANYTENKRIEAGIAIVSHAASVFHSNWIMNKIEQHGTKAAR